MIYWYIFVTKAIFTMFFIGNLYLLIMVEDMRGDDKWFCIHNMALCGVLGFWAWMI